jgi:exodeoxyribonuclease VII large subunit
MVVPDRSELQARLTDIVASCASYAMTDLGRRRWQLGQTDRRLRAASPLTRLSQARQRLDDLVTRTGSALRYTLGLRREHLAGVSGQLAGVSPYGTLGRGYAIVRRQDSGAVVESRDSVGAGDAINIQVRDGSFGATVA